ncbi:MAG: GTP-binding protein EngB [Candidatus Tectomicrobia bacterium]|uniref:GTP-binding protein EngB n=1 Tax=Tectimicrobiota bacterium TaxID=2528274 RepID=A0A932GS65_UNCTE|nr:GTP-binding protein EngB [Candidatus Tectomicrobia bacterium]
MVHGSTFSFRAKSSCLRPRSRRRAAIFSPRALGWGPNVHMTPRHTRRYCRIDLQGEKLLELAVEKLGLSARGHQRILKVARTIADLAEEEEIRTEHLSEAIQYRSLDRRLT